ncbi:hypothetical protein [Erythrobacter donghaensis]|uniref:hypothetical protein n=1 Tax=Erythrobacter donghaensis TaxID=267135 RepID=UPI000A3B7FB0|nr:hypothetical protein [Erythrobacter donghaensis]
MILAAALLLAAPVAPLPLSEPDSEILVLANLRSVSVNVGQDREGRWHCGLDRSTGRASLDDKLCRAVTKCVRKGAADTAAVDACIRTRRAGLVREVERAMKKGSK